VRYLILTLSVLALFAAGAAYEPRDPLSMRVPAIDLRPDEPRRAEGNERKPKPRSGAARKRQEPVATSGASSRRGGATPTPAPAPAGDGGGDEDGDDDDF
jgi:hypothetical protein